MKATLADLGIGNIHSLAKALERQGATVDVTTDPAAWLSARVLVLPGVGSFGAGLRTLGPVASGIRQRLEAGVPCLGVCLGMQLLFESSQEDPGEGVGFLLGNVPRFPASAGKVPHMGWTRVAAGDDPLFDGVPPDSHFYFVHSYYTAPGEDVVVATARHGIDFPAVVRKKRTVATQFHPEKSADAGLRLIKNFIQEAEEGR